MYMSYCSVNYLRITSFIGFLDEIRYFLNLFVILDD